MTLPINAHLKLVHSQETQWVEVSEDLWKLVSANQDSFIARCRPATEGKKEQVIYVSSQLIKSVYGSDALSRLDDEEEEEETMCRVEIRTVQLIELDEIILGALNEASYTQAQKDHQELRDISFRS
ncbi:hypothetical protein RMCBS344292_17431 [Rhizopus microsporus]|nr:hypothetical protein RMCBS344292_17431 [Rhizopus microsporus]